MSRDNEPPIRLVGALCVGLGAALLIFVLLIAVFAVFAGVATDFGSGIAGILAFGLGLGMSSALMNCGLALTRVGKLTGTDAQALRLNWTALVIMMVLGVIPGAWLSPYLSVLAIFVLVLLIAIRGNVRRLI